jgi:hypothetical protein
MIAKLIDLLILDDFYGVSKRMDIAKGMYQIPYSFKSAGKQIKRIVKSKR